jgi:threonine aldolase
MDTAATLDRDQVRRSCTRFLTHHYPQSARDSLRDLADALDPDAEADMYGSGELIESFEARIAKLLGKEAAVFMPSGTMCQQIALRIWTDRRGIPSVAMHPRNHLDRPEQFAYSRLHGLHGIHVGHMDRLMTLDDLNGIKEPIGALLLELPQREIGGLLPTWDELVTMCDWARERGMPVHMDGARLWESQPFYDRTHAEIAGVFDTVYVSFYKGLGGLTGSALAGPADVIAEARVWQRRHGGNLIRLYPYVVSAQLGLDRHLPRMADYCHKAREVAQAMATLPDVLVMPTTPQTNMMHLFLRGEVADLEQSMLHVSDATGVWLFSRVQPGPLLGYGRVEFTAGEATLDIPTPEIVELFAQVFERAGSMTG